jgi:rhamnogalacturonan endolyase
LKKSLLILFLINANISFAQVPGKLIYADNFQKPLNSKTWIAEIEPSAGNSVVYTKNNALVLDTKRGVTVWLNQYLHGNIQIEFDRKVLVDSGKNDRLSDFNQFWMATDPHNKNLFTRNGKFEAYDDLQLYYVGMGGNTNKTTRFRKYDGGQKPLIKGYLDKQHLLLPNKIYHIKIMVKDKVTSFWVDDVCYFSYADPKPLTGGYFGFRSTWSRQEIKDLKIYQLSD